jgi:hypothetical protein
MPDPKRILLIALADTAAAISAGLRDLLRRLRVLR